MHIAGLILTALSVFFYHQSPPLLNELRLKSFDLFLRFRPAPLAETRVVIVDIDSSSLRQYGQWPWPRDLLADLLTEITDAGPAVVGFDILFAEPDRTSPRLPGYNISPHDLALAERLRDSRIPVILGHAFTDNEHAEDIENTTVGQKKNIPGTGNFFFIGEDPALFIHHFTGVDANLEIFEKAAQGSGFFNIIPDKDSINRRMPLLISYADQLYPSLILSMIQAAEGAGDAMEIVVDPKITENGVRAVQAGPYLIPTTDQAELLVYFSGPAHTVPYIPACDILSGNRKEELRDAYVLIGTSAPGLFDLRPVPTGSVFPGVELHAHALNTVLSRNFLRRPEWAEGVEITYLICTGLLFILFLPQMTAAAGALLALAVSVAVIICSVLYFRQQVLIDVFYPMLVLVLQFTVFTFYNFFTEEKKRRQLRSIFTQYLSPTVVKELLNKQDCLVLDGEERELTILFSDIRKFTAMAERMPPDNLCIFLNEYLTPMTEAVMERRGTVDKFIGDAVMAFWNAPLDTPDHVELACDCALAMLKELAVLNASWAHQGLPEVRIGIGIHCGVARVGNMGSQQRFDYTVMGDTVNLASRLEGLTKVYGVDILISGSVREALDDNDFFFRHVDTVRVSGKQEPVTLYQLLGVRSSIAVTGEKRQELKKYQEALSLYNAGTFTAALSFFQELRASCPADKLYSVYEERCRRLAEDPPENWGGITELQSK